MKRVRVDDRVVAAIALIAGVAAAFSSTSPTGAQPYDAIVLIAAIGAVTWAAASAPWWAAPGAAGAGAIIALQPVVAAVGAVAALLGMWVGTERRDLAATRAAVAGIALNVLCRSELDGFTGASSIIGIGLGLLLLVGGVLRRHRAVQRWIVRVAIGIVAFVALAGGATAVTALLARADVAKGQQLVADGVDSLRDGEYVSAAESFTAAAAAFESAESTIVRPWTQPGRLVPVASHNRLAIASIVTASADASRELANASLFIEPDDLRPTEGRFDLDALDEIVGPVTAAYDALVHLRTVIDEVESPWLLRPVEDRLDSAAAEFDDNIDRFDTAVQALQLAPQWLGADAPRRYFLAFTTPAEARGLGGFMGNYAVLTADNGLLTMSEFGRTGDLNDGGSDRRLTEPAEWLERWGRYGFNNGPGGTTGSVPWSNITISPDFPSTAQAMAFLYPQSGGTEVAGVFALDPYVLQALVGFTGPVDVPQVESRLTESNTAQFLLFDQYAIEDAAQRADLLQDVAVAVFDKLLGGALPSPTVVARDLDPLAEAGRLVAWAADAREQEFFERVGLDGGLPELVRPSDESANADTDGFEVVVNNAAANKLDAWLDRSISYRAQFDPSTRAVVGTLEVTFTNNGPTSGLPSGVIDNYVGDPVGTNRSLVSVYTAFPVTGAELDGDRIDIEAGREAGWYVATHELVLPPGESRTLSLRVAGVIDSALPGPVVDVYGLLVGTQPLVVDPTYDIEVTDPNANVLTSATGPLTGVSRFAVGTTDGASDEE